MNWRLLVCFGVVGGFAACNLERDKEPLDLKNFPRAYTCDPFSTDGSVQCTAGWSCGLAHKCFDRDAGTSAEATAWQCEDAGHCPSAWQCGVRINDAGYCQQIGVGAASQCLQDRDCQSTWRCSVDQRCFDPESDAGQGSKTRCSLDGPSQCPNGFRCGQEVNGVRLCLDLSKGTEAPCTSDEGCSLDYRCDTSASRCTLVTDTLGINALPNLRPLSISPLLRGPVPSALSVSRLTDLPRELVDPRSRATNYDGLLISEWFPDAGIIRAIGLTRSSDVDDAGMRLSAVAVRDLPFSGPVDELVVLSTEVIALSRGGVHAVQFDGGVRIVADAGVEGIRANDADRRRSFAMILGDGRILTVPADGGAPVPFAPSVELVGTPDGSVPAAPFAEFMNTGSSSLGITRSGGVAGPYVMPGESRMLLTPALAPFRSLQAAFGERDGTLAIALVVEGADGGQQLLPFVSACFPPTNQRYCWTSSQAPMPACPANARLVQLSWGRDNDQAGPMVRCALPDGQVFTSLIRLELGMTVMPVFNQYVDDLVPFETAPLTIARAAPLVRAHAGKDTHVWFTVDRAQQSQFREPGSTRLTPLILDRQPDSMLSLAAFGGTVALSNGVAFNTDSTIGLTASLGQLDVNIFGLISNQSNWMVTNVGILNLAGLGPQGAPSVFAAPVGGTLASPISGSAVVAFIDGLRKDVILLASGDAVWSADVTVSSSNPFAPPASLAPVFVPQPGVALKSLALIPADAGVHGFVATNTNVVDFASEDLVRWTASPVPAARASALPLEVWSEGDGGRVGTRDGRIWSLPIMVPLSGGLPLPDGGSLPDGGTSLRADDFARKCGETFVTTRSGLFHLVARADGGLPGWESLPAINATLDSFETLRLYEAGNSLYVGTKSGQVVEIQGDGCP